MATHANSRTPKIREGQNVALVYERLRAAILKGELDTGGNVSIAQLASAFDTGRTPLREALRMLQHEGLVIAEPNRQMRIAALSADDFEEISIARLALETVAIRITVPTLTRDDIARLEGLMAEMEHYQKVDDPLGLQGPHRAFHRTLVAAVGPQVSLKIGELADHAGRYRLRFAAFGSWDDRRAEHRAILDAAAAGDGDRAADRLAEHYLRIILLVFSAFDRQHSLERLRTTVRAVAPGALGALQM